MSNETATVSPIHDPETETTVRAALSAEREGFETQQAKLSDLEYVRERYAKRGARQADRAFDRKVEALRAKLSG